MMRHEEEYAVLMDLFVELVESQHGRKIEPGQEWLNDAQVLSVKLYRHLASMQILSRGAMMEMRGGRVAPYIDHSSVKVIARAALETYLVSFYIYGTNDRSISLFRHMTWHLGGLTDRQAYRAMGEEARDIAAEEREAIERLKAEIERSEHYLDYSLKQRRALLDGNWRVGSAWSDLATQANFHEGYFRNIYNYLCGYSHSSYASALQVRQAESIEDQTMLTGATIGIGLVIMAHFSFVYPSIFAGVEEILARNPKSKAVAETWRFGREDMVHIYGE